MAQYSYAFSDVTVAYTGPFGNFDITGFADEGIAIAFEGNRNTLTMGADGGGMHSLHAAKNGVVTIRLLKTSIFSASLNAMYRQNSTSSAYWGQDTFIVQDAIRGDLWNCTNCALRKHPDGVYARDGNIMEWAWDAMYVIPMLGTGAPKTTIGT